MSESTDSLKTITTLLWKNREALAQYVNGVLTKLDPGSGFQLTIVIRPDGSGVCSVIPAITDSLDI